VACAAQWSVFFGDLKRCVFWGLGSLYIFGLVHFLVNVFFSPSLCLCLAGYGFFCCFCGVS
jgi:hypothetical protein